ncbi:MAG: acetyl-CoA hydrolase/transferase C-terminal domain-containing protein [Chloroflexota bacterium]|nr:acetyl-CoA hydrolase/transferase C-terminal domain-containing protein [Chloroflexota bacterium]
MSWQEEYRRKQVSAEEAVKVVKSGDRVVFAPGVESLALALALSARKEELENVKLFLPGPGRELPWYEPGWEKSFVIETSFVLPVIEHMMAERRCDYLVSSLWFTHSPVLRQIDVYMIELSPPDEHGYCSFGHMLWNKKIEAKEAKIVIADINPNLVRTYGDNYIHVSELDYFVPHLSTGRIPGVRDLRSTDLLARKTGDEPKEIRKIAEYVAELIRDGDTLQIGVGGISEAVMRLGLLDNKRDLGIHTETLPRGTVQLVQRGVITGERKTIHKNKVVAISVGGGTSDDMAFINNNPIFELYDGTHVVNPMTIATHDNMVTVNSALSIDLTGQIAAESLGTRMYSGTGGQLAFAMGAYLSKGGRSATVLTSTARNGAVSRIVPALEPGTIVSVPRILTDYVVTEYGIAALQGKTQRERARELINIAHPDFRPELEVAADKLYWP